MALPHRTIRAVVHDKEEYAFKGVEVYRILSLAGVRFADTLRGKAFSSSVLIARAADGYHAVFTLAELDPTNSDNVTILAFLQDGKPLSPKYGRLQINASGDKRHIRWVHQVQSLVVRTIE